eukprot:CAMPEP_0185569632 /NCGR_PEP_ID=MMETSP0434-20130131/2193_1 /TAXON_ID=626734 ORGANISM="Favella taraikaensis, Strain Fe Narragansett Bay" /NCGR_SAMPLE_ID=MMETSP0434 /ASSEMBLY_ACC=CAM_ASM_000379 /LENGTH=57 /DNA_ID=CAMNT_0028184475 /DNA_START=556 /DNA_END=728 /DNA_ORIENTATION=-
MDVTDYLKRNDLDNDEGRQELAALDPFSSLLGDQADLQRRNRPKQDAGEDLQRLEQA